MNIADYVLVGILAAVLLLAIRKCIRDRKQGKTCGGDCGHCNQSCRK